MPERYYADQPGLPPPSQSLDASNSHQPPAINTNFGAAYDHTAQRPVTHHSGGPSHSYSRSSSALGSDQKYVPYPGTPESARFASSMSDPRGYDPRTPTGGPSHSPLALADIRPRAELAMDEVLSPSAPSAYGSTIAQKTNSYLAPWPIYAYDWCSWNVAPGSGAGKMAICSYLEDPHNFIQILDTRVETQQQHDGYASPPNNNNNQMLEFHKVAEATCSYPVTRILWEPPASQKQTTDLVATSGDHLRLWSLPASGHTVPSQGNSITRPTNTPRSPIQKLTPLALLSNSKTPEHTAPLTSLDWNQLSPKLIITSSIDTTCTIWDIPSLTAKTQLIAHDKEVFDVRFCASSVDTFVSCGADGSVRMFDLRSLEHSTIIYEPTDKSAANNSTGGNAATTAHRSSPGGGTKHTLTPAPPLLRLATSPHDSHLLATFAAESNVIRILDHRQPGQALLELYGHSAPISCMDWSPTRRGILASGADDCQVLYWDLINSGNAASLSSTMSDSANNWGSSTSAAGVTSGGQAGTSQAATAGTNGSAPPTNAKGPAASWRADFEVSNLSWGPQSDLSSATGSDWLGAVGGRAVWGVKVP